ncbi:hypothetical protein OS493_000077 [Desmophyllum pertusum]|uniref:VWFA domain-containing protein n=1 Tax=Desmophyllum pertusum TaxID=174260 RepID=A0A9X0DBX6_9CNID|nr:hypothetical protein OS493_000077 [Desmophyllum pertusum]
MELTCRLKTFARESTLHNKFNNETYHSKEAILDLISNSINKLTQPTRLDFALKTAKEHMFTEESGLRPGVRSAMVLYTDGKSHPDTEIFFWTLWGLRLYRRMSGVRIIVIGIGPDARKPKNREVLDFIGGKNLFFVDDYASLDDGTKDITTLICPPDPCENSKGMDVAFVVDKTKSLGVMNFMLLKGFLLELIDALHIGPDATHTGIITFNKKPTVLSTFANDNLYNNDAVHQFVAEIPAVLGDRTFTDKALMAAANQLFTEEEGDRPEFPNVLILLTDGRTNVNSKPFSEIIPLLKIIFSVTPGQLCVALVVSMEGRSSYQFANNNGRNIKRKKNVHIVAVGIGAYEDFEGELEEIAGQNVHNASNFDELSDLFDEILAETCSVDGGLSRWSSWSESIVTCEKRTRTCTGPSPEGYGGDCEGDLEETRGCTEKPCAGAASDEGKFRAFKLRNLGKYVEE